MGVTTSWRAGLTCFAASVAWFPCSAAPPSGTEAGFRKLILERVAAYGRGDMDTYTKLLADDFVHVSDLGKRRTRAEMPAYVAAHGDYHATYEIVRLTWQIEGALAVVDAELKEHLPDHDGGIMETDIFVWRNDRWLYRHHAETEIVQPPPPVAVPAALLSDYVGGYRTATGIFDVITKRGGKLFDQQPPAPDRIELIPVGRDAFAIPGDPTLLIFVRDKAGAVTQCLWHLPSGQLISSLRVAAAPAVPSK